MSNPPYCYQYQNMIDAEIASTGVHAQDTAISGYFSRYLLQRMLSVFKITCPNTWAKNYVLYMLNVFGFFGIVNTDRWGVIPQQCSLGGWTVQYQPSFAIFTNPLFDRIYELVIDRQCSVIKLCPDWGGMMDVVAFYANQLALCAESANISFFNSHLAYVMGANNKAMASGFKDAFYKIGRGEPYAIVDSKMFGNDGKPKWQLFDLNVGSNYLGSQLLEDMRSIITQFDEEIGIPSNNNPKKERMIVDEVNANNVATYTRMDLCLECLKDDCAKARKLFGINIDFDWRYPPQTGGEKVDSKSDTINQGAV